MPVLPLGIFFIAMNPFKNIVVYRMIDVMDKYFQDLLHLTKAQSAWVQFVHYLGLSSHDNAGKLTGV